MISLVYFSDFQKNVFLPLRPILKIQDWRILGLNKIGQNANLEKKYFCRWIGWLTLCELFNETGLWFSIIIHVDQNKLLKTNDGVTFSARWEQEIARYSDKRETHTLTYKLKQVRSHNTRTVICTACIVWARVIQKKNTVLSKGAFGCEYKRFSQMNQNFFDLMNFLRFCTIIYECYAFHININEYWLWKWTLVDHKNAPKSPPVLEVDPLDGPRAALNRIWWILWDHFQNWERFWCILMVQQNPLPEQK